MMPAGGHDAGISTMQTHPLVTVPFLYTPAFLGFLWPFLPGVLSWAGMNIWPAPFPCFYGPFMMSVFCVYGKSLYVYGISTVWAL